MGMEGSPHHRWAGRFPAQGVDAGQRTAVLWVLLYSNKKGILHVRAFNSMSIESLHRDDNLCIIHHTTDAITAHRLMGWWVVCNCMEAARMKCSGPRLMQW